MSKFNATDFPGIVHVPENYSDAHTHFVGTIDAWGGLRIFGAFAIRGHAFAYSDILNEEHGTDARVFARIGGNAITEGLLDITDIRYSNGR